jgi:hypothetical protein
MNNQVKVAILLEVETDGETPAEELTWLLNLIRCELVARPNWKGKVRGVRFDRSDRPL